MSALIIFDSYFGNTEKIALAIQEGLETDSQIKGLRNNHSKHTITENPDLLILGSPTRGFRPTPNTLEFIKTLDLKGVKIAAFDTRIDLSVINSGALRFLVRTGGYAAKNISSRLKKQGGEEVIYPEGFLVMGEEGPLKEGEYDRAVKWGKEIVTRVNS